MAFPIIAPCWPTWRCIKLAMVEARLAVLPAEKQNTVRHLVHALALVQTVSAMADLWQQVVALTDGRCSPQFMVS